jgi:hypothetical protein
MFIYCFDEKEMKKLNKRLILLRNTTLAEKNCWIFAVPKNSKFKYEKLDKTKCLVTNKLNFLGKGVK